MHRMVILYGLILAIVAFILSWLDYRFWLRDIGIEVYGLGLAVIFAALGMWIEHQRNARIHGPPADINHKAIKALELTRRETEMLGFLVDGKSNKQIARDLGLSPNTIKTHLASLYIKLGVSNRTQAVTKAIKLSLIAPIISRETPEFTHLGE